MATSAASPSSPSWLAAAGAVLFGVDPHRRRQQQLDSGSAERRHDSIGGGSASSSSSSSSSSSTSVSSTAGVLSSLFPRGPRRHSQNHRGGLPPFLLLWTSLTFLVLYRTTTMNMTTTLPSTRQQQPFFFYSSSLPAAGGEGEENQGDTNGHGSSSIRGHSGDDYYLFYFHGSENGDNDSPAQQQQQQQVLPMKRRFLLLVEEGAGNSNSSSSNGSDGAAAAAVDDPRIKIRNSNLRRAGVKGVLLPSGGRQGGGGVGDDGSLTLNSSGGGGNISSSSSSEHFRQDFRHRLPYFAYGKYRYQDLPYTRNRAGRRMLSEIPSPVVVVSAGAGGAHSETTTTTTSGRNSNSTIDGGDTGGGQGRSWLLPNPLRYPLRNHDSIILEYDGGGSGPGGGSEASASASGASRHGRRRGEPKQILINVLGRWNRHVQAMDLLTGEQWTVRTPPGEVVDPNGDPLDDLNHVKAVLVDSLGKDEKEGGSPVRATTTKKEIWLPCGFRGDAVNREVPITHARIVDLDTMKIRAGPRLPAPGGACVAAPLAVIEDEPPMVCSFGGTADSHDSGVFVDETNCYDRVRDRWWKPFGNFPMGLDHGSLAYIPAGTCSGGGSSSSNFSDDSDEARLLVFNFRTQAYGGQVADILVHDIPSGGWTVDQLEESLLQANRTAAAAVKGDPTSSGGGWYYLKNITYDMEGLSSSDIGDVEKVSAPRDAAGALVVNGGKTILNFGGVYYKPSPDKPRKKKLIPYSVIRAFDVCTRTWKVVDDLSHQTFAVQTAASAELQLAVTCGGEESTLVFGETGNFPYCVVNRLNDNIKLTNPYGAAATTGFPPDFVPGRYSDNMSSSSSAELLP